MREQLDSIMREATQAGSRDPPFVGPWTQGAVDLDQWLAEHKIVASATAASVIATFTGFPLDSLKSRLQSSRENVSLSRLAADVIREEGIGGLWRGFPLPLVTISVIRAVSFSVYTSTKRILNSTSAPSSLLPPLSNLSQTVEPGTASHPWVDLHLGLFARNTTSDVAMTSFLAGGASGAVVCVGSAPFELVKVRRQLEFQIYRDSHPELFPPLPVEPHSSAPVPPNYSLSHHPSGTSASGPHYDPPASASGRRPPPFSPPSTFQAVKTLVAQRGIRGLYIGWRLHFVRDMTGTALYFMEYDVLRHLLGRKRASDDQAWKGKGREGEELVQGDVPEWARAWLPKGLIPFLCGSVAGVTSWAVIYPVDAIKTKYQQRALSGQEPRAPLEQLRRLLRGTDKDNPKPVLKGMARLYRGLGISMIRSMLTHGLLWTLVDTASEWIDTKPFERMVDPPPR